MYLVYIDESGSFNDGSYVSGDFWKPTSVRESTHFVVACIIINTDCWKKDFNRLKKLRKNIKTIYNIPISDFLHATELVAGLDKWRHISRKGLDRPKRITLLRRMLHEYGQLSDLQFMAAIVRKDGKTYKSVNPLSCRRLAYEALLNRIERTIDGQYMIIHDGTEDLAVIRMIRKIQAFNVINGVNRPIQKIVEDPLFKKGSHSYYLQAIDHIAYCLLHMVDKRCNQDISSFLIKTRLLHKIGVAKACHYTASKLPGIIPIPTPKKA